MKDLKEIKLLKKESTEDNSRELSDKELEIVIGGMKKDRFELYVEDLLNQKLFKS
jgi:hypothetical protein